METDKQGMRSKFWSEHQLKSNFDNVLLITRLELIENVLPQGKLKTFN